MKIASIILAAGHGTRMCSKLPKVLHTLAGRPLILHALEAVKPVTSLPVVVIGHGADAVRQTVGERARFALQDPQLGTGHAVQSAVHLLKGKADLVTVTFADMPLLRPETLVRLTDMQKESQAPMTMATIIGDAPRGFGRIVRDAEGHVCAIVEEADCTPEQLAIREYNVSAYCFKADWLWQALEQIPVSAKGEYYLTDVVALAVAQGFAINAVVLDDPNEGMGINNRQHLAEAESILHQRINTAWMLKGVTMIDPQRTYIEMDVQIGQDTIIYPETYLKGATVIGEDCILGPATIIQDTQVGDGCKLLASVLESAVLENHVTMGPYCHLRKGAHLADGVHMGNFGEVKDSYLGNNTKMGHFSYIGNAQIGADVNIGAGTITCNYDGKKKHLTEIGDAAFIGSDTMLVAPVKIGKNAHTGAGSVITHDVPDETTVVGVPAHPIQPKERRHE